MTDRDPLERLIGIVGMRTNSTRDKSSEFLMRLSSEPVMAAFAISDAGLCRNM